MTLTHHILDLERRLARAELLGLSWAPVLRARLALLRAAMPGVLALRLWGGAS